MKNRITYSKLIKLGFHEGGAFELILSLFVSGFNNYITYDTNTKKFELILHCIEEVEGEEYENINSIRIFIDDMNELKLFINLIEGYVVKIAKDSYKVGLTKQEYINFNKKEKL